MVKKRKFNFGDSCAITVQEELIVTFGKQIVVVLLTLFCITALRLFIATSNKPKRFCCIHQYHFSSFEVISIEGVGNSSRSELRRVKLIELTVILEMLQDSA